MIARFGAPTRSAAVPDDVIAPDLRRVVIEGVQPSVDGGVFPAKRSIGETVEVSADIFADGHDTLAAMLRYRFAGDTTWLEEPMAALDNDRWTAAFTVERLGCYEFTLSAWVDVFATWQSALEKKVAAGLEVSSELQEGAALVQAAAARATGEEANWLRAQAETLARPGDAERVAAARAPALAAAMARHADRGVVTDAGTVFAITVEPTRAAIGAWYEMFPRSASPTDRRHGTLADCEALLPYVAGMGFDVLYLPPVHPIGRTHRKGPNNTPGAAAGAPGSPWAIGAAEGGHTAIHPELGTVDDFRRLVERARVHGVDIALDLAFQCSPDHPYVGEHPDWFHWRPDGTVQYAENPPKRYQDIYPLNFEGAGWRTLWEELRRVVLCWIERGVTIFRVDNPHTKPFAFWRWLIAEIHREHPEVIFLSEAFTRPKVMRYLAKAGFSQSYTYFTWRISKAELTEYFTELTLTEVHEYLRPNLFTNTPDILHAFLQSGGRPAFAIRLVLAATLGASYGIYGPAFELCEARALPQSEEYADSEKYQLRHWDRERADSLRPLIAVVNAARRANPALYEQRSLRFIPTDNEQILCYAKHTADLSNIVFVVVNLDPHRAQSGWVDVPLDDYELAVDQPYEVHDLLTDARYTWRGAHNYVALDPTRQPAHLLRVTPLPAPAAPA
jgi:starch synthase (maltosyl-transferring)